MPGLGVWRGLFRRAVVRRRSMHSAPGGGGREGAGSSAVFDPSVLQFLVCPLSRKALRYNESTNKLINDELSIAYPIVDGIPNMIPQDARMINKDQTTKESDDTQQ